MEVELIQDPVDQVGLSMVLVDPIECIACGLRRQRRDIEGLAIGRNGGDTRCETETNVGELAQFLQYSVDLPRVRPLRVEDGFCVIEEYNHLP